MAYIFPAPGVTGVQATLSINNDALSAGDVQLTIPALQDITINNANDVFTWTQLDSGSKLQVATTATNDLSMNLVLDQDVFFGAFTTVANVAALPVSGMTIGTIFFATAEAAWYKATSATVTALITGGTTTVRPAKAAGIFGLSKDKSLVDFTLYLGDTSTGATGKTITGVAYITGLAPTVSADAPVWVSPITLTVTGDYTVA
jgi:hypothetical protein